MNPDFTKMTKKALGDHIKDVLNRDDAIGTVANIRALIRIWTLQTAAEQVDEATSVYNGVGFTGVDGQILTSIANRFIQYGRMSDKQYSIVKKKMNKYWKQLMKITLGELQVEDIEKYLPKSQPQYWVYVKKGKYAGYIKS